MLRRIFLLGMSLTLALSSSLWARAEFHLGGVGNSWQGLITDAEATYQVVDLEGNVLSTQSITIGTQVAGVDTMIDYADNSIRPVWIEPGVNLARDISLQERDGHLFPSESTGYTREAAKEFQVLIDGDSTTGVLKRVDIPPRLAGFNIGYIKNLFINLGAELPITRILFYPRPGFEENYLAWYEVGVAGNEAPFVAAPGLREPGKRWYRDVDRSLTAVNDPDLDILARNTENLNVAVDLQFAARDLRWIAIRPINPERNWEIAEVEIYGEGFVSRTHYVSGVLDFGRPVAWSKIRWEGETPEGTRLVMRTRSGNTAQPNVFWKRGSTGSFEVVSQSDYTLSYQAGSFSQIQATYDAENWSFWSSPYDFEAGLRDPSTEAAAWEGGTELLSPGPSRFLQFDIAMFAAGDQAPRFDNLSVLFAEEPSAQSVIGEVWPVETQNFEPQAFTYVVRPILEAGDRGFDRLEIFTQIPVEAVHSVLVDGEEVMDSFPPQIMDDRIVLSFDPLQAPQDNEKRIEVQFDARVLRFGAEFTGWVYNSEEPELKQQVRAGNATFRFAGDVLSVNTPVGGELLRRLQAQPTAFTPNGDGVNDEVTITYDLRNIEAPRQISVKVFDLSGRLVRELMDTPARSGSFVSMWNGRNGAGELVAPGIYFYRVDLGTDKGDEVASGALTVVY